MMAAIGYSFTFSGPLGFWPDIDANTAIERQPGRVFVGEAVNFTGNWAGPPDPYGARGWVSRDAQLLVDSTVGHTAIAGQSKTSKSPDVPAHNVASIGVTGVAVNDDPGPHNAFGGYFEAYREANGGAAFGAEIDAGNFGADHTDSPYAMFGGGVFGLNIAAGGSTGRTYTAPSSSAIQIANNQSTWNTGIVVGATALTGTDGVTGYGDALTMAKGHQIKWLNALGFGARITSTIDDPTKSSGLRFINGGIRLEGPNGSIAAQLEALSTSANYLRFIGLPSGQAPELRSGGSDADIDLKLIPKGNGKVRFGTFTPASGTVTISGYVTIKDEAGNTIKLAVLQ